MGLTDLPGYDVLDRLGSGRDGEVWRARHHATGETVALKWVRCADPDVAQRLRERVAGLGRVATGSAAEHLVRVRAVVPVPDGLVLVLDHAAGGSLASVLAARGRLAPGEVVTVGVPIAGVLAALHAAGVVHGRVAAGNVLFTVEGRPLLADLGLSGAGEAGASEGASESDDVYALAALCWTALAGAEPASDGRAPATPAGVPSALAAAVRAGLAPDPALRPAARAWGAGLRAACAPAPVRLVRADEQARRVGERGSASGSVVPGAPTRGAGASGPSQRHAQHRRGRPGRLLARALAAAVLAAAAVALGTALSRADRASTASPLPPPPSPVPSPGSLPPSSSAPLRAAAPPTQAVDWRQVLAGLDSRRGEAFARGESLALADVYAPGSAPLARDTDALRRLVAAGVAASGLRLEVSQVRPVSVERDRVVLRVVDRLPAHDLVAPDGTVRERRPGRGEQAWQLTLVATAGEWRISAVERAAN